MRSKTDILSECSGPKLPITGKSAINATYEMKESVRAEMGSESMKMNSKGK